MVNFVKYSYTLQHHGGWSRLHQETIHLQLSKQLQQMGQVVCLLTIDQPFLDMMQGAALPLR